MPAHRIAATLMLMLLCNRITLAQPEKLKGIWISSQLEMIEILHNGKDSVNYMCSRELKEDFFYLLVHGDTLSYQSRYTASSTHHQVEYVDRYDLKIITSNDSILVVEPISDFSKAFFGDRPSITLRKKEYLTDRTISFEKLVYHSYFGGSAPHVSLQVDSAKNLYVHFRNEYGDKTMRKGAYSAVLDDDTYNKLIYQLRNAQLRALRFGNFKGADSAITTLIVYFNGKRKHLKSIAPPRVARDLLSFIDRQLAGYPGLKPTGVHRDLEWP